MFTYAFEKLDVWKKAKDLVTKIYKCTNSFPPSEKYGMVSQIRRSAISVCSNIAEGSGRITSKDKAHFYTQAYGSLMEVLNQLLIAKEMNWISDEVLIDLRNDIEQISKRLSSLRYSTLNPKP